MALKRSSATKPAEAAGELPVSSVGVEARYLAMRSLRLVMALASEVGVIYFFVMFARAGMWIFLNSFGDRVASNTGKPLMDFAVNHAAIAAPVFFLAFVTCWLLMYASGMPFRYSTGMPGLSAKRCGRCGVVVADEWKCNHCEAWRPEKAASLALWILSLGVTAIFFVVDLVRFVLNIFLWSKR